MGTTQPIRNNDELTALRINDLLLLKQEDVYNFRKKDFRLRFVSLLSTSLCYYITKDMKQYNVPRKDYNYGRTTRLL